MARKPKAKAGWLSMIVETWTMLRPLVESARKGKKPWLSLTILVNVITALLVIWNLDAVADVIMYDHDNAKMISGAWAELQVY